MNLNSDSLDEIAKSFLAGTSSINQATSTAATSQHDPHGQLPSTSAANLNRNAANGASTAADESRLSTSTASTSTAAATTTTTLLSIKSEAGEEEHGFESLTRIDSLKQALMEVEHEQRGSPDGATVAAAPSYFTDNNATSTGNTSIHNNNHNNVFQFMDAVHSVVSPSNEALFLSTSSMNRFPDGGTFVPSHFGNNITSIANNITNNDILRQSLEHSLIVPAPEAGNPVGSFTEMIYSSSSD